MRCKKFGTVFVLLTLTVFGPQVFAIEGLLKGADLFVERQYTDIRVNLDGSYTQTDETIQRLQSERAVHEGAQVKIPYSSSLEDLTVLEAYTLKADGRHIAVPERSTFLQDGLLSETGVTSFQDIRTLVIVYPEVEPGDATVLKSLLTRKRPPLPGIFTFSRSYSGDFRFADARVTIIAPLSLGLRVQSEGVIATPVIDQGNQRKWQWSYKKLVPEWPESDALNDLTYRPRIFATSLKDWSEFGRAAYVQFKDKSVVTPRIQSFTQQLTAAATTPQSKALLIHDWVARNIRYFAIVLDVGGYVPRSADVVFTSRYGDCKDHAVLLKAMLAAVGLESETALITTESMYELPTLPVMSVFNHAITHVPSLNVYLESTTPWTAFGVLPTEDAGKPTLLLSDNPTVGRTPAVTSSSNQIVVQTSITVRPDGSASGQDSLTATGASALGYNSMADWISTMDPTRAAKMLLLEAGMFGEGIVTTTKLSNASPFRLDLLYELNDFAPVDDLGAVRQRVPMDMFESFAMSVISEASSRKTDYTCYSIDQIGKVQITFPVGTTIKAPKSTEMSLSGRSYRSSYRVDGSTIYIERKYQSNLGQGTCKASDYANAHAMQQAIFRDMRRDIVYTRRVK